jgi:hypothetical protein
LFELNGSPDEITVSFFCKKKTDHKNQTKLEVEFKPIGKTLARAADTGRSN